MTEPLPPESDPAEPLQFDNAEYSAEAPATLSCAACSRPISGTYFEVNGKTICDPCRSTIEAGLRGGSGSLRFLRASLFGTMAAFAGFVIYFAVLKITGLEIGLISILVGFIVGTAVRAGSHHRGGLAYQGLAVLLTYCAIVASYSAILLVMFFSPEFQKARAEAKLDKAIAERKANPGEAQVKTDVAPDVQVKGFVAPDAPLKGDTASDALAKGDDEDPKRAEAKLAKAAADRKANPGEAQVETGVAPDVQVKGFVAPDAPLKGDTVPDALAKGDDEDPEPELAGKAPVILFAMVSFLFLLPIKANLQSPIGLLIVGFALWQAWKLNTRTKLVFNGPYEAVGVAKAEEMPPETGLPGHA